MITLVPKEAKTVYERYLKVFKQKGFAISFIISIIFLIVSLLVNHYASTYATESVSNPVTDIILSNIRAFDVDGIFVYGPFVFWTIVGIFLLFNPKKVPFTLKSIAVFVLVRAAFISMTHIGPFPTMIAVNAGPNLIKYFSAGGDLFFSAHTGLPFLMALVFWRTSTLRVLFTIAASFFGVIVLMGHFHYTIDVVGAFFITYSIFRMARHVFWKDRDFFYERISTTNPNGHVI